MTQVKPLVFVIDDDASVRGSLENLLCSVGLPVAVFASAQEFLASPHASELGCLILDVRLPGVSGLELQEQLRRTRPDLPVVFITGHGDIPMSVRAMKAGAVEFLTKPFGDKDLIDAVEQALRRVRESSDEREEMIALRARYESLTARARGHEPRRRPRDEQGRGGGPRHQRDDHQDPSRTGDAQDAGRVPCGAGKDGGSPRDLPSQRTYYQGVIDALRSGGYRPLYSRARTADHDRR